MSAKTETKIDTDIEKLCQEIEKNDKPFKLVLFNDEHHSFGQVVKQVKKAVKCTAQQAMGFTMEAHKKGEAIILTASEDECNKARKVLEEIDLGCDVIEL